VDNQLNGRVTALRIAYVSPAAAELLPGVHGDVHACGRRRGTRRRHRASGCSASHRACIVSAWLLLVAANLVIGAHLDVAVRDVVMSIAVLTLARLLEIRQGAPAPSALATTPHRSVTA